MTMETCCCRPNEGHGVDSFVFDKASGSSLNEASRVLEHVTKTYVVRIRSWLMNPHVLMQLMISIQIWQAGCSRVHCWRMGRCV